MSKVLVIGYGNPLRGDDGLGWYAAQALADQAQDPSVEIMACHQLAPELAEQVSQADFVLFVDARAGQIPGELFCEPVEPATDCNAALTHHLTPPALLTWADQLFGRYPDAMEISIGGESFELGTELS